MMTGQTKEETGELKVASLDDIHADNLRIIAGLNQVLKSIGRPPV